MEPTQLASVDALSSAIFRLHEQVIPLSYLSSISGIINHFDDLHSTSPLSQYALERQIAVLFKDAGDALRRVSVCKATTNIKWGRDVGRSASISNSFPFRSCVSSSKRWCSYLLPLGMKDQELEMGVTF